MKQNDIIQMAGALTIVAMLLEACGGGGAGTTSDTSPPTQPGALVVGQSTSSTLGLSWSPSTDNVAVDHYDVLLNGAKIASSNVASYTFTGLAASTSYNLSVEAVDAAGNRSTRSVALSSSTAALLSSNAQVSYDFSAGDSLQSKNGWVFESTTWPLTTVPGTSFKGLPFTYAATTPGEYPPNSEMRFQMPGADEFWLGWRLHIPANFQLRNDTIVAVGDAQTADWKKGDQVRGADGISTGTISGFSADGIFVRYAQKGAYPDVWGSSSTPKVITNITRNTVLTSTGRSVWDTGNKLLALWNDDYSYAGTGPTIILGIISDFAVNGVKDAVLTAAYRGAGPVNDGSRTNFSNLPGGILISDAQQGKYIDLMLHAKFSSHAGAKDGVLQTWVRYEGESSYTLRHSIIDADMDKGVSNKQWQAGYLMGWSNVGYDESTTIHISKIEYYSSAPQGVQLP